MSSKRNQRKKLQRLRKKGEKAEHERGVLGVESALSMLSAETREALAAHLREREQVGADDGVGEDYHLSQFWYDDESAQILALEALEQADRVRGEGLGSGRVACLSCPSIYKATQFILNDRSDQHKNDVVLFEYDPRLSSLVPKHLADRNFVLYDFKEENLARMIPAEFHGYFDYVVSDPPYLNGDCLCAFQRGVELISREKESGRLFCTGLVLESVFEERLPEYKVCGFQPVHSCKLGNAFGTFSNYESIRLSSQHE